MTPSTRPALSPFDPESGDFPAVLEALFARPAATVPAVLVIVGEAARADDWAARTAVAVASSWAERRNGGVTLADLTVDSHELAAALGLEPAEGLADIFEFGVSLGRASRAVPGRQLRFLSPGMFVPDVAKLLEHPRWERLIAEHAEHQATVLVYVPATARGLASLARRVGKALVLAGPGDSGNVLVGLPASCAVLAVLQRPETARSVEGGEAEQSSTTWFPVGIEDGVDDPALVGPVAGDPVSESDLLTEPSFVRRREVRRRSIAPVIWILLVIVLGLGGWVGVTRYLGRGTVEAAPADATALEAPAGARAASEPIEAPMSYSVAVEAHPDFATAQDRVEVLRAAEPDIQFYLAPVLVDSVVYYRVLAGLAPDTAVASTLMRNLVDEGLKSEIDTWAIRPTVWAYLLGEFDSRDAAAARADSLLDLGVPTYSVEIAYTAGPSHFRLYAGAYEGPAQGVVMSRLLEQAEIEPKLVRRMGRPVE